ICQALSQTSFRISEVHLFAGAVEHDFDQNFLNKALLAYDLDLVVIYCSSHDAVLEKIARPSRKFLDLLGNKRLGYGYLGYQAALDPASLNIAPEVRDRVKIVDRSDLKFGHSTWF